MKKLIITAAFILLGFAFTAEASTPSMASRVGGYFYGALTPHGVWMEIGGGVVAWRPTMIRTGWQPYSVGRWIWTVDGWYWDSYEDFGYITYHYGRWHYDDYYGWIWVPDYEWAPAWVEWRYDDMYIGWAPLSPYAAFSIHIGVHFTYDYYAPYNHWHYITYNHFYDPHPYRHYVAGKYKYRIHSRTKYRNNYDYRDGRVVNRGVDIDIVRKRVGRDIRERDIQRFSDPNEIRGRSNGRGEVVRTFVVDREQVKREREQNFEVKRSDRNVNLDVARVELGDRRRDVNEKREFKEVDGRRIVVDRNRENNGREEVKIDDRKIEQKRVEERGRVEINETRKNESIERNRNINNDRKIEERKPVYEERKIDSRTSERNNRQIEQRNRNDEKRTYTPPVFERKEERNNQPKVNGREERTRQTERKEERTFTPPKTERKIEERRTDTRNNNRQERYEQPKEQKREVSQERNNGGSNNRSGGETRERRR